MVQQRAGEKAVPPGAVIGDVAGLGGIDEQESRLGPDAGQTVALIGRARQRRAKGIVAAGVQNDQLQPGAVAITRRMSDMAMVCVVA